jgi:hypothetical protein
MPGPNGGPNLVVTGRITVPTGGYRPTLEMGPVAESYPVQVTVTLHPNPPTGGAATQAVVTQEVRGVWPMREQVGSVTVRCGNQIVGRISPVETAH